MKRIILIILALVLIAAGIWAFLKFRSNTKINNNETVSNDATFPNEEGPISFPSQEEPTSDTVQESTTVSGEPSTLTAVPGVNRSASTTLVLVDTQGIKRISEGLVTGANVTGSVKGVNLAIRYMEQGTGYIYEYRPLAGAGERISNQTIPRATETWWGNRGQTFLVRYQATDGSEIKNYLARILKTASSTRLEGLTLTEKLYDVTRAAPGFEVISCDAYLSQSIIMDEKNNPSSIRKLQQFLSQIEGDKEVVETGLYDKETITAVKAFQTKYNIDPTGNVGPATRAKINNVYCEKVGGQVTGDKFGYIQKLGQDGKNTGMLVIRDFDNKSTTNQVSLPTHEWRLLWPNLKTLVLVSSPSAGISGHAYSVSSDKVSRPLSINSLAPLISDVPGLTLTVNSKLNNIIYSASSYAGTRTQLRFKDNKGIWSERPFPLLTFPQDKCTWSNLDSNIIYCAAPRQTLAGNLPDAWYQGLFNLSDNIYKVNLETDTVTLLYTGDDLDSPDVIRLIVAPDDSYLFFINKKDNYLWQLPLQ